MKEFIVTVAVWLLSVGRQEVSPTGKHVAGHVLHDHSNTICLFIKCDEELILVELIESFLGEFLVCAQAGDRVCEIVCAN